MEQGKLYIVATPIGNLEDITLRALRVLKEVDLIAAEDTRRTKKLLSAYDIDTPLTSLYDQNEAKKSAHLISRIQNGKDMAYVSDAGTPAISDPGYILVKEAISNSIRVIPIPGPSAVIASLSASGLPTDSFAFYAFLPSRTGKRKQFLRSVSMEEKTMVFYESPNRLISSLQDILEILGDRKVAVFRELTKIYEEVLRGHVSEILNSLNGRKIKGEITLVVAGAEKTVPELSSEQIRKLFEETRSDTVLSKRDIIDVIAKETGLKRREVYRAVIQKDE
ncbi:MAG: 16S rRNA (cytidine(1402)-2'-O)-methyltransferase [Deltaproteobacteria bacterium]|nr:16S rRNA (cytidine(1402)-2'-O)-methyltransferase [Deltaproteobacteria bacterium]